MCMSASAYVSVCVKLSVGMCVCRCMCTFESMHVEARGAQCCPSEDVKIIFETESRTHQAGKAVWPASPRNLPLSTVPAVKFKHVL